MSTKMMNAGRFAHRVEIVQVTRGKDADGFPADVETVVLRPYADIKTTRGFTLISNGSDFEKAFTNFTIRFPAIEITREMLVRYGGKVYSIEYLNNVDLENKLLEIQAKEVTH